MGDRYDDIINLPHPTSKKHPRMSMTQRAAQFAPFAAVHGHSEAVHEANRITMSKIELGDDEQAILDMKQNYLMEHGKARPDVMIVYFLPDQSKAGGSYITKQGYFKYFDAHLQRIILTDNSSIPIGDIVDIKSSIFKNMLELYE